MNARMFRPSDVVIAIVSTVGVQVVLFLAFFSASSPTVRANILDDHARPVAVAITPVSSIPGFPNRLGKLPRAWQRQGKALTGRPGKGTSDEAEQQPTESAGSSAGDAERPGGSTEDDASPFENSDDGASDGDRGNGLETRAIDLYRVELVSWFMSRFEIRGKLPFETLKNLRAVAALSVSPEHTVDGYRVTVESGNPVFDAQVRATLAKIQETAAPLPPPPPLYPELLGKTLSVSFKCTVRRDCE